MRTFAFIFVCGLLVSKAFAQHYTEMFFSDMEFGYEMDSLSYDEFSAILEVNEKDFAQPLYTFGSDDPEEWELIGEAYVKYPEIVKPRVNKTDLDGDGNLDLVLSFLGGNEYSFVGMYLKTKVGYTNIFTKGAEFFGRYGNGDVCVRRPACCDDPTNDYHRYTISDDGTINCVDSFSISTWRVMNTFTSQELYQNSEWEVSSDTLYVYRDFGRKEIIDFYLPGARMRMIRKEEPDKQQLMFCEIIGELDPEKTYHHVYKHAFVWLTKKKYLDAW